VTDFWGADYPDQHDIPPYDLDGAELLDDVETFLARFVVYPGEAERVAHVLWIVHAWLMDAWESTPRIAFLSPEPGSGKSRALEVTEPLVPRPIHAVNTTPSYLFRKVADTAGAPTILYDEIDTLFGPKAKDNEEVRGMLNAGHRKGAKAGRCVVRGNVISTEELDAYCAVALAGLDDLPDTLMTRSVIVRMRRRSPAERIEPWRRRINAPEAEKLADRLAEWTTACQHLVRWPDMPDGIEDRPADVWEPLLAVADLAGKHWPERSRRSAVALVAQSSDHGGSLGVMLLRDLRDIFGDADRLPTEIILARLIKLEESPWGDLRGKPLDARGLARRLGKYGVQPKRMRDGESVVRGYEAAELSDPFNRYLPNVYYIGKEGDNSSRRDFPPSPQESATSATDEPGADPADRSPADCPHGKPGGDQPADWLDGRLLCTECRLAEMAQGTS
jgi:hypothetical protein